MTQTPPRWDLTNVYTGLSDPQLQADMQWVIDQGSALEAFYKSDLLPLTAETDPQLLNTRLNDLLERLQASYLKAHTIGAYLNSFISTDSYNKEALRLYSQFNIQTMPAQNTAMKINAWLGKIKSALPAALSLPGTVQEHAFYLGEAAEQAQYLMSEAEEILANELSLSGGHAWDQLQGTVTSQKTAAIELEGEPKQLPMPALINLHGHAG